MILPEKPIPAYLTKKRNIIRTVFFTALFALAFINFYSPFGVNVWFHVTRLQLFFYSSMVILTGILVIVVSRIIMYHYCKRHPLSFFFYGMWVLAEILSMAAFYTLYVRYSLHDDREFLEIYQASIKNTALVLLLPYSILWLFFAWNENAEKLEELSQKDTPVVPGKKMLPFHDEKNTLRFSILKDDLLYLESTDNYVTIHYLDNRKVSRFMVRNTLKYFEDKMKNSGLVRCHRSFMVNFDKVRIMRKEKDGLHLELDSDQNLDLPVSKTYVQEVINAFSRYSQV